jgi:hypothetical protein
MQRKQHTYSSCIWQKMYQKWNETKNRYFFQQIWHKFLRFDLEYLLLCLAVLKFHYVLLALRGRIR